MAQVHYAPLKAPDVGRASVRWTISGQIDWREWDGEFVARSEASGLTCVLSPLAGQVLRALRAGANRTDDIARRVFSDRTRSGSAAAALSTEFARPEADEPQVRAVLEELVELGFVEAGEP
jgi:hypothetical protein